MAPIESTPAVEKLVVQVASPLVRSTGWAEHPLMSCPLLWKSTVPPSGTGLTVALKITDWPVVGEAGSGAASVTEVVAGPPPAELPTVRSVGEAVIDEA